MSEKRIPIPTPGHFIGRRQSPEKVGSVIIPDSAKTEERDRIYMVANSGSYVMQGLSIPMDIPDGALLFVNELLNPVGYEQLPEDHFIGRLLGVYAWRVDERQLQ